MVKTSMDYRRAVVQDRIFHVRAVMRFPDGTEMVLTNTELMTDGLTIKTGVSGTDSFDIGSVSISECTLRLDNTDGRFNPYDFEGAVINVSVGLQLSDDKIEWIPKGIYTAEPGKFTGAVISVTAYDNMARFDRPYTESVLKYPATLGQIIADACSVCGVVQASADFPNRNYTVKERPDDEALTFRQVLTWVGQIACRYWQCDAYGRLTSGWYDTAVFGRHNGMDGGSFDEGTPVYGTGDSADGGSFMPWTDEDSLDGGTFESLQEYHHLYALNSINVATDDVVITGIKVTEAQDTTVQDTPPSYMTGVEGYVLEVKDNDFIRKGNGKTVADYLGGCLIGMKFRPVSLSCLSDPAIEAGDPAIVTDYKQNTYECYITNTTYQTGNYQSVSCDAKTPARNSASRFTEATQAFVKSKKNTKVQINEYDKSVQALTSLITQSFGVYKTEEKLEDGSTIFYMHNKPTLKESDTIWKMTANAFAVSTDGGKTWNAGMDSQGNAVVNVLSAIGIRFDWARGGTLTLGGENNVSGSMHILDEKGNQIGLWDNSGITAENAWIKGTITTKNNPYHHYLQMSTGALTLISEKKGKLDRIYSIHASEVLSTETGEVLNYGPQFVFHKKCGTFSLVFQNAQPIKSWTFGSEGATDGSTRIPGSKSGRAEFSDGSYLDFKNGFCVGGKTASGSTF
ncbi:hypothetical protein K040078D81_31370 [Blautia hominis]|uniref:Uncharacterized protein n=1 Tax=Blautia hominis TaxID=2025493 RepID=A0ABQ0BC35_9FIRM